MTAADQQKPDEYPDTRIFGLRWIITGKNRYGQTVRPFIKRYESTKENLKHFVYDILINDRLLFFVLGALALMFLGFLAYDAGPEYLIALLSIPLSALPSYIVVKRLLFRDKVAVIECQLKGGSTVVDLNIPETDFDTQLKYADAEVTRLNVYIVPRHALSGPASKDGVGILNGMRFWSSAGKEVIVVNSVQNNKLAVGSVDALGSGLLIASVIGEKVTYLHKDFAKLLREMTKNPAKLEKKGVAPEDVLKAEILWKAILQKWQEILNLNSAIHDVIGKDAVKPVPLEEFDAQSQKLVVQFSKACDEWFDEYVRRSSHPEIEMPLLLRLQKAFQYVAAQITTLESYGAALRDAATAEEFRLDQQLNHWGIDEDKKFLEEREVRRKMLPQKPLDAEETPVEELIDMYERESGFRKPKGEDKWQR